MKENNKKQTSDTGAGENNRKDPKDSSKFIPANEQKINDPQSDRSAKTSRKGAGQQQGSSGSPINS